MNISMTMVQALRRSMKDKVHRIVTGLLCVMLFASLLAETPKAKAQRPDVHFEHAGVLTPGAIGRRQLVRGGPLRGYIQTVEITGPKGAKISLATGGAFDTPSAKSRKVGMYISPVYRLKITNIPQNIGAEIYPTIEVIDRMYPPIGKAQKFPIPVEFTRQELELAIAGKYITKVIYMENPRAALPLVQDPKRPLWYQIAPGENPLEKADQLGRPMAIIRIGGRLPVANGPTQQFLYGSPTWMDYTTKGKSADGKRAHYQKRVQPQQAQRLKRKY